MKKFTKKPLLIMVGTLQNGILVQSAHGDIQVEN